jgi:hypothetical protein
MEQAEPCHVQKQSGASRLTITWKATAGVECRKDADVIDETPMAYKSIDAVMEAQTDLVEVVHTLRRVVCVKGWGDLEESRGWVPSGFGPHPPLHARLPSKYWA